MVAARIAKNQSVLEIADYRPHIKPDFSTARTNGLKSPVLGCRLPANGYD